MAATNRIQPATLLANSDTVTETFDDVCAYYNEQVGECPLWIIY